MIKKHLLLLWKVILALSIILTAASMVQVAGVAYVNHIDILHSIWIFLLAAMLAVVILGVILFILLFTRWKEKLLKIPEGFTRLPSGWKVIAIIIFILLLPVYSFVTLHPYLGHYYASGTWTHLALFWWLSIAVMVCLKAIKKDLTWPAALWIGTLIMALFFLFVKQFLKVTDYPFALTWSEASRFYGASLLLSKQMYGTKIPLGIMHATWHFLLAVPFLFGNLPIWLHRLWWALLQLVLGVGVSWTLANRLHSGDRSRILIVAGWVFIFLFPLPLLANLLFCTLLIMWGVKPKETWRTSIIVTLASIWAGMSRINWFPVPGIFAAILFLLEVPYHESRNALRYLWKPIVWILGGTLIAFASNVVYMQVSGNGTSVSFSSSLTSTLLWYRLLPNPTYPAGVLPDLLLLTAPVIASIILGLRQWRKALHPLRLAGIVSALAVLLVGGLVVSVKIGGGGDLHNLDAYLILLILVGGYLFFGSYAPEALETKPGVIRNPILLSLLLIAPIWLILRANVSLFIWDKAQTDRTLAFLRQNVEDISRQGGQVLFISERQLLTFKMVDVPLVPDYEQDFLMEMVMSHNRAYLDQFQADLRAQRFAAIVTNAQSIHYYGRTRVFGEENDVWVQEVSIPLLCSYEPLEGFSGLSEVVYVPRSQPCK
jgi:hypothetical protein